MELKCPARHDQMALDESTPMGSGRVKRRETPWSFRADRQTYVGDRLIAGGAPSGVSRFLDAGRYHAGREYRVLVP